jgi:hypothetical protein
LEAELASRRRWTLVLVNMASMLEKIDEMLLLAVYKKVCTSLGASRRRWAPKPFVARSFKPPTTYSKPTPPRVMIGPVSSLSEPSPGPPSPSSSPSPAASSRSVRLPNFLQTLHFLLSLTEQTVATSGATLRYLRERTEVGS